MAAVLTCPLGPSVPHQVGNAGPGRGGPQGPCPLTCGWTGGWPGSHHTAGTPRDPGRGPGPVLRPRQRPCLAVPVPGKRVTPGIEAFISLGTACLGAAATRRGTASGRNVPGCVTSSLGLPLQSMSQTMELPQLGLRAPQSGELGWRKCQDVALTRLAGRPCQEPTVAGPPLRSLPHRWVAGGQTCTQARSEYQTHCRPPSPTEACRSPASQSLVAWLCEQTDAGCTPVWQRPVP